MEIKPKIASIEVRFVGHPLISIAWLGSTTPAVDRAQGNRVLRRAPQSWCTQVATSDLIGWVSLPARAAAASLPRRSQTHHGPPS